MKSAPSAASKCSVHIIGKSHCAYQVKVSTHNDGEHNCAVAYIRTSVKVQLCWGEAAVETPNGGELNQHLLPAVILQCQREKFSVSSCG